MSGEYGLFFALFLLVVVGSVVGVLCYGALKLSLKNPNDIP